ncbi:MAG TPA: sulfatase-like hydrolase/transferase, partial [Pirellulales bacterium]|nr:sulfatase-like hydrolase/transferase [Pirellulales bacterium]
MTRCSPWGLFSQLCALCVFSSATSHVAWSQPSAADRPNVVFILLDNCGQEWFGCYDSDEGRTPAIDALARGGTRFEHCYTFPVCGPSRIELLTGRYPFRNTFVMHHDAALYGGGGLDPQREVTFARVLRSAGYVTGIVGKWQVNNLYDEPDALAQHGFDEHLVWPGSIDRDRISAEDLERFQTAVANHDADSLTELNKYIENRYWDPVLLRNGKREVHPGKFGPNVLQAFALEFLARNRERPFLLYYPMVLTHGASFSQHVVATPLDRDTQRSEREMYGDMVAYADKLVGELVEHLSELGLRE